MKDHENIFASPKRLAVLGTPYPDRLYRNDVEGKSAQYLANTFRIRTLRNTLDALDIPCTVEMSGLELAALICEGKTNAE